MEDLTTLSQKFRFSYFSSKYWLESVCKIEERNNESLALIESLDEKGKWILQYTPEKTENLYGAEILWATQSELDRITDQEISIIKNEKSMQEYFFKTSDLISLDGSANKQKRRDIRLFEKKYSFKLVHTYDKQKTIAFLKDWDQKQEIKTAPYKRGLNFCYYLLDYIDSDDNLRANYVLIDNNLVGFSIGEKLTKDHWIGLHQKTDYKYLGIGRWMIRERAKLFVDVQMIASGGSMADKGIAQFKESFNPTKIEQYYHVILNKK
ncbi:MAG: phosphatidylglycerol lysyltransferase domain-containing protein [Candidatus Kerfeldbacteria bacterium]